VGCLRRQKKEGKKKRPYTCLVISCLVKKSPLKGSLLDEGERERIILPSKKRVWRLEKILLSSAADRWWLRLSASFSLLAHTFVALLANFWEVVKKFTGLNFLNTPLYEILTYSEKRECEKGGRAEKK